MLRSLPQSSIINRKQLKCQRYSTDSLMIWHRVHKSLDFLLINSHLSMQSGLFYVFEASGLVCIIRKLAHLPIIEYYLE